MISVRRDRIEIEIEPRLSDTAVYRRTLRRAGSSAFVEPNTREA